MASKVVVIRKFCKPVKTESGIVYEAEYRTQTVKLPCVVKPQGCNSIWFINKDRAIDVTISGDANFLDVDEQMFVNHDPRVVITSDFNLK